MASALITIDQSGKPPGIPGAAREDLDLFSGANAVVLTNDDDTGVVAWTWTLLDRPNGSAATLSGAATATAELQADVRGSYLVRLVTSDGVSTYTDETIAAVVLEGTGWRVPAARETTEFHPTRGWAEELDEILRASSEGPRYLREQASDPVTPADLGALYAKDAGGQSELFYRRGGSGTVFQLTPPTAMALSLQDAYDDGPEIVSGALGPVVLTHGAAALDTQPVLHVRDLNANPGRTQALALFEDANAGTGPLASFVRTTAGPELQVYYDKAAAASNGEVIGSIPFYGHDSAGAKVQYAGLQAASRDVNPASLDGDLWLQLMSSAVVRTPVRLQSNTGELGMLLTQPGAAAASWPGLTLSPNSTYTAGQFILGVYNNNYSALAFKVDGPGTMTVAGAVQGPDGSASDTTFRPSDSMTTGIYFTGSGATKATAIRSPGGVVVTVGQFQTDFQGPLTVNTIVDRSGGGAPVTISGTAQVTDGLPAIQLNLGSWSSTSGTRPGLRESVTFAPTSGTAAFIGEDLAVTVNQTGGANGDVTAHRISLTETAVGGTAYLADWRAGASGSARRFAVDRSGNVTLQSDSAGTLGPELQLYQDSASPAAADVVGRLAFHGEDDGSTKREYARIEGMIFNPAAANPNGRVSIYARGGASGGAMTETFRTYSDQFGNVASGTSRLYTSFLYGGGLTFYGDNQNLTISTIDPCFVRIKWLPRWRWIVHPSETNTAAACWPEQTGRSANRDLDLDGADGQGEPLFGPNLQARHDGLPDVAQSLLLGLALAHAAWNRRAFCHDCAALIALEGDRQLHGQSVA